MLILFLKSNSCFAPDANKALGTFIIILIYFFLAPLNCDLIQRRDFVSYFCIPCNEMLVDLGGGPNTWTLTLPKFFLKEIILILE